MKKYFKKSLSLLMAALMLMSCWVFFAPEAEAVSAGKYYYKLWAVVSDGGDGQYFKWSIRGKKNNGTASQTEFVTEQGCILKSDDTTYTIKEGTADEFPTQVYGHYYNEVVWLGSRTMKATIHLAVGTSASSLTEVSLSASCTSSGGSGSASASGNTIQFDCRKKHVYYTINVATGSYPKANSVEMTQPGNVTVPKTGNATTSFTSYVKDQYGVVIGSAATGYSRSVSLTSNRSSTTGISAAYGLTTTNNDPCTITVNNSAKLQNYDTNTITAKASYTFNGATKTASKSFVVTDPQYTFSFNANGGTISPNAAITKYYYNTINANEIPSSGTKTGYEFIGMYKDARSNYAATKPTAGTTSGFTDNLKGGTPIESDTTYYAAWWAKNVKVTFLDNAGNDFENNTFTNGKYDKTFANSGLTAPENIPFDRQGSTGTFNYVFDHWEVLDAKDINGNVIQGAYGTHINDYVLKGDTVFIAKYSIVKNYYTVEILNEDGTQRAFGNQYSYRDTPATNGEPTKASDNYFDYTFKGWHKVADGEQRKGYVINSDGYLSTSAVSDEADEGNKYIGYTNDLTVRADATYVPVFEKTYINYTVNFEYKDALGNTVTSEAKTYHYNDDLALPEVPESYAAGGYRYYLTGWNSADGKLPTKATENKKYVAQYGDGEAAEYTIKFNYKDSNGNDADSSLTVKHGETFVAPVPAQTYRDESNEYTFDGWLDQYGEKLNTVGNKDAEYTAQYTASPLYTVTFVNEGEQFGEVLKYVKGEAITLPGTPTKEADVIASKYTFTGWKDENGNAPSTMGEENLVFEAQYDPTYIDYTVKFAYKDENGTDKVDEKKYHYGEEITIPEVPDGYEDDVYQYTFKAWDNDVLKHCTEDVTYTATYRRTYVYYSITFYKEVINADGTISYKEYSTDSFIHGERIRVPVVPPDPAVLNPGGDANKTNVISGWTYKTASGKTGTYKNGDTITENMEFYPVYTPTKSIKTVTFLNESGTKLGTVSVEYGETIENKFSAPKKMYTDDIHYAFDGWLKEDGTKFDETTPVTENITLKVSYREEAHKFEMGDPDVYPTFFETGLGTEFCECGKTDPNVSIEKIPDSIAPTTQLYVKNNIITSGDEVDMTKLTLVAPSSNLIIATDDKAEASKYNKSGRGVGTGTIEYAVTKGRSLESYDMITDWTNRFNYDEYVELLKKENSDAGRSEELTADQILMLKEFETNTSAYVSDLADACGIENGDEFIFYAKITDRCGNTSYIHSGVLVYDNVAPKIELSGDGNGSRKFCTEFTATATDETSLVSFTADGTEIEVDKNTSTVTVTKAGNYKLIATDEAGNTTVVNVTVVGEHKAKVYTTAVTCESDGHEITVCTVCNKTLKDVTTTAIGHNWVDIEKVEATCVKDGYTLKRCSNCAKTMKDDIVEATGKHTFGDWKVITEPNCSNEGKKYRVCTVCSYSETAVIEMNPEVHKWSRAVVTPATCTEAGYSTRTCKLCGKKETIDPTPALGHTASDEWTVLVPAKCEEDGQKVKYCVRCGEANGIMESAAIPAPGHSWAWKETVAPTAKEEGYTVYVCMVCGETKKANYVEKLAETTITFFDEDGTTELHKFADVVEGRSITAADVADPTKAEDNKCKYVFSHWVNVETNEKVNLPLVAGKNDISVKAVYTSIEKKFTITLYYDTGLYFNKVGYLTYGTNYEIENPNAEPKKDADSEYTYEFAGWVVKGSGSNVEPSKTIVVTANEDYEAVFTKTVKKYTVTFAYNYSDIISQYDVEGGTILTAPENAPEKAYDDKYHYDFAGWNVRDGKIGEKVTSNVLAIAEFNSDEHNDFGVLTEEEKAGIKEATCTETGINKIKCSCGHIETVVTPALGHSWGEYDENGVRKCLRDGCGATETREDTYSVSFIIEGAEKAFKIISGIKYNGTVSTVPTAEKASTVYKTYTFKKWYKQGDEAKTAISVDEIKAAKVTSNVVYVAAFEEADRYYNVHYAIDAQHVLKTYNVKAGSELPAYDGATPTIDRYDSNTHQVFDRWTESAENYPNGVVRDLYITAKFKSVEHTFEFKSMKNATCTEPMKETYKCTGCSATYEKTEGKALGHNWVLVETIEPSGEKAGYRIYKCDRAGCGETKTEEIGAKKMVDLIVTVVDQSGNAVEGATVSVFEGTTFIASKNTDSNGVAIFRVEAGKKYRVVVEYDGQHREGDVTVDTDGSTSGGTIGVDVTKCSCTCHRDGIWPAIFRFFHKVIKMLVGHFVCCGNPDARYGS